MSLVEQALARMRSQAGVTKPSAKRKRPSDQGSAPIQAPVDEVVEPLEPAKRMTLDSASMRAKGYLPEESRDRQFADHYRRIKRPLIDAALAASPEQNDARVIMVTSALPGDGKTFTSINLALSMALERDISVLLIDCDVAKRHISQIVGMEQESGLLDALLEESIDVETLVAQTNIKGLSILPAGRHVETSPELLSSNRMRQIITELFERNPRRILLLDSPPLLITNESRSLLKMAGQIALVVRAGHTSRHAVQEALALFDPEQRGGLILNQVATSSGEYIYGYDSYGYHRESGADANKT